MTPVGTLLGVVPAWLWALVVLGTSLVLALAVHSLLVRLSPRIWPDVYENLGEAITRHTRRPGRWLVALAALWLAAPLAPLAPRVEDVLRHTVLVGAIGAGAWFVLGFARVFERFVDTRYDASVPDNLQARRVQTKVRLLRRIVTVVVTVVAFALILVTFDEARRVGVSLFASAGIVALVVGIAAQPTVSNLIAGLQVALAEPIRLDDVVIVEGEWGRIEEIGTSFVVVRIWDERRLVVPLRHFIERPFQNWTRKTSQLVGSVFVYVDYRVPVEAVRQELRRIVERTELWDGRVWNLQVTDASERSVELRALVSAADAGKAWDLRCHVREKLLGYLQREHPDSLPRARLEMEGTPARAAVAAPPTS